MAMYLCSGGSSGTESNYDYDFVNYNTKNGSGTSVDNYNLYTFLFGLFDSTHNNKDFEMLINYSDSSTNYSTESFILGSMVTYSIRLGIEARNKHLYLRTMYLAENNSNWKIDDLGEVDGEDIIIKRINRTIQVFHNDTKIVEYDYYSGNNRVGGSALTLSKFGDYARSRGIFNKFAFKWLT